MSRFLAFITSMMSVGLIGVLAISWVGPHVIAWWFDPPVSAGINCKPAAEWAMDRLLAAQVLGLVVGLLLGSVAAYYMTKKSSSEKSIDKSIDKK